MKVALVNSLYYPYRVGGAEYSVQLLAEELASRGDEVAILTTEPGRNLRVEDVNGVSVYYMGLRNIYWPFAKPEHRDLPSALDTARKSLWHGIDSYNLAMAHYVRQVLTMFSPDVVHTNNLAGFSAATWQAADRSGFPIVHTIRDYYAVCPASTMYRDGGNCESICLSCRILNQPRRYASRLVTIAVGISYFILDLHLDAGFFPNAQTAVLTNPVVLGPITRKASVESPLRFGYLGRLEPQKGVDLLLEAFTGIPNGRAKLVLAGTGDPDYVDQLHRRFEGPDVVFLGWVDSDTVYADIDVVVVPAVWNEPLNRTVLEASAHGLPTIGMRVGGVPEIIEHGHTGLLVDAGDIDGFRRAMQCLIADRALLAALGDRARRRVEDLTPRDHARAYSDLYRQALDARHSGTTAGRD